MPEEILKLTIDKFSFRFPADVRHFAIAIEWLRPGHYCRWRNLAKAVICNFQRWPSRVRANSTLLRL